MQINKLIKVGERTEVKQILHPSEAYENPDTGLEEIRPEWLEEIEVVVPIMEARDVDMTEDEAEQAKADAEQAKADAEQREKDAADATIDNLMQALSKATPTKVQAFKTMFDGLKMVYDADNPEPYVEGVTVPQNNAYYLINGVRHVYMDGNFIEF